MRIQEYLACAIQNMQVLMAHASKPTKAAAARLLAVQRTVTQALRPLCVQTTLRQNQYLSNACLAFFSYQGA
jgi:hypothetical protein